jgi:3-methyladenine DNA glycosylase/8-oxoguanine DNA glycosylase
MHRRAIAHLKKTDPVLDSVIDRVGAYQLRPRNEGSHFDHIARAIVYQQLSGKAAATIHGRLCALFPEGRVEPALLREMPDERLRAAGLSRQKIGYLRDLATHTTQGTLRVDALHELPDEEIATQLVKVKGVGIWTAQMFLIFRLGRPDVLPVNDLGIRKGVQVAYRLRKLPSPKQVEKIGAKWTPFRSVASWYLWRLLDVAPAPRQKRARQKPQRPRAQAGRGGGRLGKAAKGSRA